MTYFGFSSSVWYCVLFFRRKKKEKDEGNGKREKEKKEIERKRERERESQSEERKSERKIRFGNIHVPHMLFNTF